MKIEFGDLVAHGIAVSAGAALSLRALPGATLAQRACNLSAGIAIAVFCGAALIEHWQIASLRLALLISFVLGATGLVAFDALIEAIKKTDLVAWISGWLPGRKGGQ